jgi:predicted DsbA family dithiol-disulfide isomerase
MESEMSLARTLASDPAMSDGRHTSPRLTVSMIMDLVCSWCPIGYMNLKHAANSQGLELDLEFLPFELYPQLGYEGASIESTLRDRMGLGNGLGGREKFEAYQQHVVQMAKAAGVEMNYRRRTHYFNTRKAHRLMHLASDYGQQQPMMEAMMNAYFSQGKNLADDQVLGQLAHQVLGDHCSPELCAQNDWLGDASEQNFARKRERIAEMGAGSIPAFSIAGGPYISGSASVEELIARIQQSNLNQVTHQY